VHVPVVPGPEQVVPGAVQRPRSAPVGTQQPLAQRLPGQHAPPGTPQRLHTGTREPGDGEHTVSGSEQGGTPATPRQQIWPALPHSHWPARHTLDPPQLPPSTMQVPCTQQLLPLQVLFAQHAWPAPPQATQVGPIAPRPHTNPAPQAPPAQQGCPPPPHARHVPVGGKPGGGGGCGIPIWKLHTVPAP
jgi:hypothetical protein